MPRASDPRKEFTKIFNTIGRHHHRREIFDDFLEMATTTIRKRTMPPSEAADELEAHYMKIVARYEKEDIHKMPQLLGLVTMAMAEGGQDFLGSIIGELELLDTRNGQFFTPYTISRMIAEMSLEDAGEIIKQKGFITVQEPACGAGGMVIAAADVLEKQGHEIGLTLYVDAIDVSNFAFQMSYLQIAVRGIPATVRRGDTLRLEMYEHAITPALIPFMIRHGGPFKSEKPTRPEPQPINAPPAEKKIGEQLNLFPQ